MANPLILTLYTDHIDIRMRIYHEMVVSTLTNVHYISQSVNYWTDYIDYLTHGDILNEKINWIFSNTNHDIILNMDIDCIPLNDTIINTCIEFANKGYIIGNGQICPIGKNKEMYVGPSFCCFHKDIFYECGRPNFAQTNIHDTGEFLTIMAKKLNIPCIFFEPKTFEHDITFDNNDLRFKKYGFGTTFEFENQDVTYHLFFSRENLDINKLFYNKSHEIIQKYNI